ncbi:hypothetical protein AK830_g11316 [Neonectria ditissima]|uniref:Uncharacterized protein n=1 Tax=Neonectria ditissima TaxID=78410 RepID=A0A0N8H557_9HYPO|nr:hypothetical protein AK830_g11316 [Neonectria ditissima]
MNHSHDAHTPLASHTKSRHPQYNSNNVSAAERGQAAAEKQQPLVLHPAGPTQAPDTEDAIDAGWEDMGSEPSAPTAPSTSASGAGLADISASTPGSANPGAALTSTSLLALELTASNMALHELMCNRGSINERIWNRQRGHSTIVTFPYTSSDTSIELGEPFGPFCVDGPASSMFGIGAWADTARPPML